MGDSQNDEMSEKAVMSGTESTGKNSAGNDSTGKNSEGICSDENTSGTEDIVYDDIADIPPTVVSADEDAEKEKNAKKSDERSEDDTAAESAAIESAAIEPAASEPEAKAEHHAHKTVKRRHAARDHVAAAGHGDGEPDENIFAESLDKIKAEELGERRKRRFKPKDIISKVLENAVLIISAGIFLYCVVNLVVLVYEQLHDSSYYQELLEDSSVGSLGELIGKSASSDSSASEDGASTLEQLEPSDVFVAGVSQPDSGIEIDAVEYNEEIEEIKASIAALADEYPDIFGWIYIPDTGIDYPIVKGDDNEYYLTHAFTGDYLVIGSIFADYRLDSYILNNYNTVLYGHRATTAGTMFNDVKKFAESEEFFNNHNIYIYTATGYYEFEPFNVTMFSSSFHYFQVSFSSPEEFVDFAYEMQSYSSYNKNMTFDSDDRILTLSTCTNTGISTLRYCLQAKLVDYYE
ncbi:MAG: class B sortase [Firmicutes bacterium]|nr:class B sortase [Bacillota bacterium]